MEFRPEGKFPIKVQQPPLRRGFCLVKPCLADTVKQQRLGDNYLFVDRINVNFQSPARSCRTYKKTRETHMKVLQKTAIAMAAAQLAPGSGAYAKAALGSTKNENVVIK
jgi:hypothetical protein